MSKAPVIRGIVRVPGDKSISHRSVIFPAIASGKSRVRGFLRAEDTFRTVAMMRAMGVAIEDDGTELVIDGVGLRGLKEPADLLDAGNSGTTIRISSGLLAAQPFLSIVTGDVYLRRRPMKRVVDPLRRMGASIDGRDDGRLPPLVIRGGSLKGMRHDLAVASAQVKSAILLAGLYASGTTSVAEPLPSRDHSERLLSAMGAKVEKYGNVVHVSPAERLDPVDIFVPGDISSAAFFICLAAGVPGSRIELPGIGVNQRRTGVIDVLRRMGAKIEIVPEPDQGGEPVATLVVHGAELRGSQVAPEEIPDLVDEVPALCVAAAMATGRTEIRGAHELRVKESDRIGAMVSNLAALDIPCGEYEDGLWIEGGARPKGGVVGKSFGDHRIAMSLRILSAATGVAIGVDDSSCVATSFPEFENLLSEVLS